MNIVSVMAHQDDELMCLGTMLKMKELGHELHFVCITDGSFGMIHRPETPLAEVAAIRYQEMSALVEAAGGSYICLNEKDEYLYDTPELRDALIGALRTCRADVVFTHFSLDYNVDHMTTNLLVRQAAMQSSFPMLKTTAPPLSGPPAVFLAEPSGGFEFEPTHYVDITKQIVRKQELSLYHKSQDEAFRAGLNKGLDNWILENSRYRGSQVGVAHAEGFRPMFARGLVKAGSILP